MSIPINVGIIESYVADVAVTMVFGLGYYLFKKFKRNDEENFCDPEENLKGLTGKLGNALERWQYAKTIEEYNEMIQNNYGDVSDPFTIINIMNKRGIMPNVDTYNALFYNCLINGNGEGVENLKEEILDPTGPVTPNSYTLNIMVKGLFMKYQTSYKELGHSINNEEEEENRTELNNYFDNELLELINSMEERDVFCDLVVHTTILEILIEQDRLTEAWNQYDNIRKIIKPDYYTYIVMLKAIKKCDDYSEEWLSRAINVVDEAKKNFYELEEEIIYHMVEACIKFNRNDKAEKYFNELKNKKSLNEVSDHVLATLVKAYAKNYNFSKVEYIYENINKYSFNLYEAFISAAIRCKQFDFAEKIMKSLKREQKSNVFYTILLNGYKNNKNYDKAIKLYSEI